MQNQKVLVIGGTGKTGRKVVDKLNQQGVSTRIGSRSANPAFDWHQADGWAAALEGIDKVYITYQPDLAVPGAKEAISKLAATARAQNVQKLVLLSGRGEEEAQACERIVMNSGLDWTIVRADWFNQNFSENFLLEPVQAGHVALPKAAAKIPFIDTDDISDVAVAALTDDKHNGQVYELTGPRLLTFKEVVAEIVEVTGRDIQFHPVSMEAYKAMMDEHQVPADFQWLIEYLFTEVLDGRNEHTANGVQEALGRPAKDFSQYARETAATGIWNPVY